MTAQQLSIKSIMAMLEAMPPETLEQAKKLAIEGTKHMRWVPNIGPQLDAYESTADQLLYGGQAGGGKTDILVGKATQRHRRSLILRRLNAEVQGLIDRTADILGTEEGYSGKHQRWYLPDGRLIMFGAVQHPGDERKFKGEPKDFIGVDEASEFPESVIDYVIQWLRTTDAGQQTQLCLATNPPDSATGAWLVNWFGPWVDPDHPMYPQADGKLLYFERVSKQGERAEFRWSEEPFEIDIGGGKKTRALSRTFIRSKLSDNPDLDATDYAARLASAPEELRARYERGEFVSEPVDDEYQVFPTLWVLAAQNRWKDQSRMRAGPPENTAMTALGVDIAVSIDRTVLSPRYGSWFGEQIVVPGKETSTGDKAAALIIRHLRDGAQVNLDLGGGWGSSTYEFIKNNDLCSILGVVPGSGSMAKSACGRFKFRNKRAEMHWRLREALDPLSGFNIALPPDPELREELCVVHWTPGPGGMITVQEKSEIKDILRRSPDKSDSIILAWASGNHRQRALALKGAGAAAARLPQRTNADRTPNRYDRHTQRRDGGNSSGGEQG